MPGSKVILTWLAIPAAFGFAWTWWMNRSPDRLPEPLPEIAFPAEPIPAATEDPPPPNDKISFADPPEQALHPADSAPTGRDLSQLLDELMALDPVVAAQQVQELKPRHLREEMTRRLMQAWTAEDPEAAFRRAAQLPRSPQNEMAMIRAAQQILKMDPQRAMELVQDHDFDGFIGSLIGQWAEQDLSAASTWAIQQPPGEERDQLLGRVAFVQSKSNPAAAAQFVVNEITPGNIQIEAAVSVLHQWAIRDFKAAMAWASLFPDGPLRDRAVAELEGIDFYQSQSQE